MNNHSMNSALKPDSAPLSGPDHSKAKAGWPKTPDGTIDWETVFETPDTGLIAMVADVGSADVLYKVTEAIIRQLFTRRGDEIQVERFLLELTRITGEADGHASIGATRDAVVDLLRRIKHGRIQKAAAYVAEQKRKAVIGKRKRREAQRREADRQVAVRTRVALMAVGGIAALLILAGAAFVISDDGGPGEAETAAQSDDALQSPDAAPSAESWGRHDPTATFTPESEIVVKKAPDREYTPDGYPLGRITENDLADLGEHVMTLPPIRLSRNIGGGDATSGFVLPALTIRDPDNWSDICGWAPSLTEAITGILVRGIPATGDVTPSQYRAAGEVALQLVNQRLGGVLVDDMFLLYDVDRSLTDARARCRLVTEN